MECINNNVKVLIDNKEKNKINLFKKSFITFNFGNLIDYNKLRTINNKKYYFLAK